MPLKLISWNIQFGHDNGPLHNGWKDRKAALAHVLEREQPDVLCIQEALPGQLAFLDRVMSGHDRVGVGRDGGRSGEHCAIYFNRARLLVEETQTFWLSERPETGGPSWDGHLQRIVTWAKLSDRKHGRPFRVFNTHFPLNPSGRRKSAQLLVDRLAEVREPVVLAGDFNCGPRSSVWKSFHEVGLHNAEAAAGRKPGSATFRLWKFGVACLDGVFACKKWQVHDHQVLKEPVSSVYPSDHYGVSVRLFPAS